MLFRMLPRRRFLLSSLALAAFESLPAKLLRAAAPFFKALPAWKTGILEIHQIATNRGNSTLLILPDGTTMMVDAGAICTTPYLSDPLPSGQHRPGEWIGRYAKRRFDASGLTTIDTFLLTHLHGDHVFDAGISLQRSCIREFRFPVHSRILPCSDWSRKLSLSGQGALWMGLISSGSRRTCKIPCKFPY